MQVSASVVAPPLALKVGMEEAVVEFMPEDMATDGEDSDEDYMPPLADTSSDEEDGPEYLPEDWCCHRRCRMEVLSKPDKKLEYKQWQDRGTSCTLIKNRSKLQIQTF